MLARGRPWISSPGVWVGFAPLRCPPHAPRMATRWGCRSDCARARLGSHARAAARWAGRRVRRSPPRTWSRSRRWRWTPPAAGACRAWPSWGTPQPDHPRPARHYRTFKCLTAPTPRHRPQPGHRPRATVGPHRAQRSVRVRQPDHQHRRAGAPGQVVNSVPVQQRRYWHRKADRGSSAAAALLLVAHTPEQAKLEHIIRRTELLHETCDRAHLLPVGLVGLEGGDLCSERLPGAHPCCPTRQRGPDGIGSCQSQSLELAQCPQGLPVQPYPHGACHEQEGGTKRDARPSRICFSRPCPHQGPPVPRPRARRAKRRPQRCGRPLHAATRPV